MSENHQKSESVTRNPNPDVSTIRNTALRWVLFTVLAPTTYLIVDVIGIRIFGKGVNGEFVVSEPISSVLGMLYIGMAVVFGKLAPNKSHGLAIMTLAIVSLNIYRIAASWGEEMDREVFIYMIASMFIYLFSMGISDDINL